MNFLARFVRFVVWVLLISWIFKLVGRLAAWALRRAMNPEQQQSSAAADPAQPQLAARQLVRDPICGMHLAETLAIPYRDRGELLHFCSAECRDKYAGGNLRRAVNG
jgi:YHS domain-containing protein